MIKNHHASKKSEKTLFSQDEVNQMISKRMKRATQGFEKDFQLRLLQIEVLGTLKKEKIPTSFGPFIIVSKNEKRIRNNLEQFIKIWQDAKK